MADATTKQLKKNRIWVKKQITLDKANTLSILCSYIYSGTGMPTLSTVTVMLELNM
jgi:hypothetical protein